MEKGQLVEFRLQGERRLAVIDRPEGKKDWIVIDERGHPHKIRPQQVDYEIQGGPYKSSDIAGFLQEVQKELDESSLEIAWEIVVEEGTGGITPADLAQLLFSQKTPQDCYIAHNLLIEDKVYFKRKGELYEARSLNQVEEIKHQLEVEKQKQQEKEEFILKLRRAQDKEQVEWTESDRHRLEALERYVLQPEQTNRTVQELLNLAGKSQNPEAAWELIVELGWWSHQENLFLRRSSYPNHFPKKVLEVADSHLASPPLDPEENRLDLTHLKIYTIDDESTKEIDDGLSIEHLPNGEFRIWVHIADPTRLVLPGDELDLEARRRSTSLYLPTGMVPMFPPELATGPMSLLQGKLCAALSFGVSLDAAGAIIDYSIHSSLIKPTYRLTYEDVDEMLHLDIQAEPEISTLAKLAKLRHLWRKSQGAINISMPEAVIKVSSDDQIKIELQETSIARQLVAEMMILTGEVTGKYCQKHQLPVPFRGQPQPELPSDEELLLLPAGPVRSCALRRCMPRSEISINPVRHASLGLETYIQVTSPIRRYTDLLVHFQIKAHLRGETLPFTTEEMQEIIYSVTAAAQEAVSVERQTNRYWGLEYLRRNANEIWQVLVLRWLREDENLGLILLEELGLELPHRFERNVSLGDRLTLQVSRSDPQRDEIRFREPVQK